MRTIMSRIAAPLMLASLLLVGGCATTGVLFPPAEDLRPDPKPQLDPAALASDKALNDYDAALEAWGERRDAAVARTCRWAVANGAKLPFECPKPPT